MAKAEFPAVPIALLKALEEVFPDTLPDSELVPVEIIRALQGQQKVIRFLRKKYEKQNENILEK